MRNTDYVIIGGGIIGMMTARELSLQGASVSIFDRGNFGMESSIAAGGILSSMRPWIESKSSRTLSEEGKKFYPDLVKSLCEETGIDSEYIQSGLIIMDKDHSAKTKSWAKVENLNLVEKINNSIEEINLPKHSILLPDIAQVRPPFLIKALYESLKNMSVSMYEETEIKKMIVNDNKIQSIECTEGKVVADIVIVTAGAWSNLIVKDVYRDLGVSPIKGEMLCVKLDEKIFDQIILDGSHYLIPRKDGHVLIGSTMEDTGFVNETSKTGRKELLDWVDTICPILRKAKLVSHWSGLRPSSSLGKAIIGKVPNLKNLYLNTGHFRKGILQAPASAKLLVDTLNNKPSFMDIDVFNVENLKEKIKIA